MINLLPNNEKDEIQAARTNIVLVNFIIFLSITAVFLAIACFAIYNLLGDMQKTAESSIKNKTAQMSADNSSEDIGRTIATAESIFKRKMLYGNILIELGSKLPYGVVVDKLSLDNASVNETIKIELRAKSSSVAPELIANLKDSKLFYDIQVQSPIVSAGNSPDYPILINCSLSVHKGGEYAG
ncbi:MAG: PilN domain-containing protein [Candidatus Saccharibacteria bacterium]